MTILNNMIGFVIGIVMFIAAWLIVKQDDNY